MAGLKEFFEKLASDTDLQEKVKAAEGEEAFLKVITDAGYDVKPEELKKFSEDATKDTELSDSDLDNVAGGFGEPLKVTLYLIMDIKQGLLTTDDAILRFMAEYKAQGVLDEKLIEEAGLGRYLRLLK